MNKRGVKVKNQNLDAEKTKVKIQKNKVEIWLGIANLILVIVIGIGLAIYFKVRDENFQTSIIKTQVEIQRQSKLAHIRLDKTCFYRYYCGGSITVNNNGPENADNLRLTLSLSDVSNPWQNTIKNIDVFALKIDPVSLTPEISKIKLSTKYGLDTGDGNNTIKILISSLPPNQKVQFFISFDENLVKTNTQRDTRDLFITNNTTKEFDINELRELISNFLEKKYEVASFDINVSCDNCEGDTPQENIYDSSDNGWGMSDLVKTSIAGKEAYQTRITSKYAIPIGITRTPSATNSNDEIPIGIYLPPTAPQLNLIISNQPKGYELLEIFP